MPGRTYVEFAELVKLAVLLPYFCNEAASFMAPALLSFSENTKIHDKRMNFGQDVFARLNASSACVPRVPMYAL